MKVILISYSIRNSSFTEFFIGLSNRLSEDYKLFVLTDVIQEHDFEISPKIKILRWPHSSLKDIRNFLFLIKLIAREKPEMMISNFSAVNFFALAGKLSGVRHRIAWCHSISGAFVKKKSFFESRRLIYKLLTQIIANSQATKIDLLENFTVPSAKIKVFYNAIKEPRIIDGPINFAKQILYVGNLNESKGIGILLEAMVDVIKVDEAVRLKIIGGDLRSERAKKYFLKVEELGLADKVEMTGWKSKEEVFSAFQNTYLTIVPSFLEGFGYVVIESFSVKTPVIGSNTTGIAEIIRNGKDGLLFEPGDVKDLSEKILHLLEFPELREEFSENCYQRFLQDFELNSSIEKISKYLKSSIEKINGRE